MLFFSLAVMMSIGLMGTISSILLIPSILWMVVLVMIMKWAQSGNPWVSLIFVLAYLGGMMIIFMYMVSILPLSKSSPKNKPFFFGLIFFFSLWFTKSHWSPSYPTSMFFGFPSMYWALCFFIILILVLSSKMIKSPFKALSSA